MTSVVMAPGIHGGRSLRHKSGMDVLVSCMFPIAKRPYEYLKGKLKPFPLREVRLNCKKIKEY
jgi:hypothetical protein